MHVVKEGGYIQYAKGRYTDSEGVLKTKEGQKVLVIDGWKAGEVVVTDFRKTFTCYAYQIDLTPDILEKKEESDYEHALKCVYRIVSGKDTLQSLLPKLSLREQKILTPLIENMLNTPNGIGDWHQSRERVWWNIYREDNRWEILCVVRKKRVKKYVAFTYLYDVGTKREFHGRFLSLRKAQYISYDRAHRRSRWIPVPTPSHETFLPKKTPKILECRR